MAHHNQSFSFLANINTLSNDSLQAESEGIYFKELGDLVTSWMWIIWPPIVLLGGTFGNVCTIILLGPEAAGKGGGVSDGGGGSTISVYLLALACSDLVALYCGLLRYWLFEWLKYELYSPHRVLCKVGTWLWATAWTASTYLLVALTLQRALSVVWPHRVRLLCTRSASFITVVVIVVASLTFMAHAPYGYDLVFTNTTAYYGPQCVHGTEEYNDFITKVLTPIGVATHATLPFLVLMVSNVVLARSLVSSVLVAGRALSSGAADQQVASRKKKASSTTVTVILISLAFVALNLPLFVYMTINTAYNLDDKSDATRAAVDVFFTSFVMILMFTNFSTNFYLYCLSGSRFRGLFCRLMTPHSCGWRLHEAERKSLQSGAYTHDIDFSLNQG